MSDKVCVWKMGTDCGGVVEDHKMFSGQLTMGCCENHFQEHLCLVTLNQKFGVDVEKVLGMSVEERMIELDTLCASNNLHRVDVLKEVADKESVKSEEKTAEMLADGLDE